MVSSGVARDELRAFVDRIERLEEEKQALADDIKEVYAEAKGGGFDTKVLRQVIRIRKQDAAERAEQEAILDLYLHALGMIPEDRAAASEGSETVAKHKEQMAKRQTRKRKLEVVEGG